MNYRYFLVFAALLGAGAFVLWQQPGSRSVTVASPRVGLAVELVYATGVIEPVNQTGISAQSAGELAEFLADEGDTVTAGQILGRLDATSAGQKVGELSAKLELERKAFERATALRQRGAGSQEALDDAQSRMQQTQAQLEAARDALARRNLQSPINGIVLRRDGKIGEFLAAGTQVFVVGDAASLRAELEVDEEDIPRVQLGQKVLLTADAFSGRVFEASVSEITPLGDTLNKSYRVRANLAAGNSLPVGMTVEANIVMQEKQGALLVPTAALVGPKLFVVEGRHVRLREVQLGITGMDETEVTSGLDAGAELVAQPPADLKDGDRVKVAR